MKDNKKVEEMKNKLFFKADEKFEYIHEYKEKVSKWFCSEEIKELVDIFQGNFPMGKSEQEILSWLVEFSDIWDYRKKQKSSLDTTTGERARWLVSDVGLSKEQKNVLIMLSENWDYWE